MKIWDQISEQRCVLCRSRRELSNGYLLAKIGIDTAENGPRKFGLPARRRILGYWHTKPTPWKMNKQHCALLPIVEWANRAPQRLVPPKEAFHIKESRDTSVNYSEVLERGRPEKRWCFEIVTNDENMFSFFARISKLRILIYAHRNLKTCWLQQGQLIQRIWSSTRNRGTSTWRIRDSLLRVSPPSPSRQGLEMQSSAAKRSDQDLTWRG